MKRRPSSGQASAGPTKRKKSNTRRRKARVPVPKDLLQKSKEDPRIKRPSSMFFCKGVRTDNKGQLDSRVEFSENSTHNATAVVPKRKNHNRKTLMPKTEQLLHANFPMEMLPERGNMWYLNPTKETMMAVFEKLRNNASEIRSHMAAEENHGALESSSSKKRKKKELDATKQNSTASNKSAPTTVLDLSWKYRSKVGFNSAGRGQMDKNELSLAYSSDKDARWTDFFSDDRHEPETGFQLAPQQYVGFRQLRDKCLERFRNRRTYMSTAASNVPRVDLPVIRKAYIALFRRPPMNNSNGQRKCVRGHSCLMFTSQEYKRSPFCYVGCEFLVPSELATYNRTGSLPSVPGPCIECLLYQWTNNVFSNLGNKSMPCAPMNTFTVLCEPGEYDPSVMLPVVVCGGLWTGISGHVPRYDHTCRHYTMIPYQNDPKKEMPYLAEVHMDFRMASAN